VKWLLTLVAAIVFILGYAAGHHDATQHTRDFLRKGVDATDDVKVWVPHDEQNIYRWRIRTDTHESERMK
jgi:hypothetical protein